VAGAAAGTLMALHSADTLELSRGQLVGVVLVLAVVTLIEGLERLIGSVVRERHLKQARQFSETLRALLVQLVDKTQVDWKSISVSAFLVRRRYRWFGREELNRVGRERIRSIPRASNVSWTRGKGVIGQCWANQRDFGLDLRAVYAEVAGMTEDEWSNLPDENPGITEQQWSNLPDDIRYGLSYHDFLRTRHHNVVVATPILNRSDRVIGVVTVDSRDAPFERLASRKSRETLGSAAEVIRNLLE
jgi:hypothetical protein